MKLVKWAKNWRRERRRVAAWRRAGVFFLHVPKAAGTSCSYELYDDHLDHLSANYMRKHHPDILSSLPGFTIVRNPWDRVVSAYRFALNGKGLGDGPIVRVHKPERFHLPEFSSFERFVHEWLCEQDLSKAGRVFELQSSYVFDDSGEPAVEHIGRLENLAETERFVTKVTGRKFQMPHYNTSGERVDFRSFYTPETVQLVGKIYAKDVEVFGYRFKG